MFDLDQARNMNYSTHNDEEVFSLKRDIILKKIQTSPSWKVDWRLIEALSALPLALDGTTDWLSKIENESEGLIQESDIEHTVVELTKTDINRHLKIGDESNTNDQARVTTMPFHASISSPITVQWLMENYETAEGVSLPRSTIYYHYIKHCQEYESEPLNAASFGKLIKSVFLGLKTRRLGTRGHSKYHYYGIGLKSTSKLRNVNEIDLNEIYGYMHHRTTPLNRQNFTNNTPFLDFNIGRKRKISLEFQDNELTSSQIEVFRKFLGDSTHALENFPIMNCSSSLPGTLSQDEFFFFPTLYREHCETILEDIVNFQLSDVEKRWRSFWRTDDTQGIEEQQFDNILSRPRLQLMCSVQEVQQFIRDSDYQFYQSVVGILLPDVLRPIPSRMLQAIRNFANGLESSLIAVIAAMVGFPEEMINIKIVVVNALAQTLRRYTSLNHLAQATRDVLQNQSQINQMLSDLNRVDFHNIEDQAAFVCGCTDDLVPDLEASFKETLANQQSLEQWAQWLEVVVFRVLRPHENSENFLKVARNLLLKWSFYSSLVIRDLTLRSAASFGSFYLFRLFFDEYMFFLVEQKVAAVTGVLPITVIGKNSIMTNWPSTDRHVSHEKETETAATPLASRNNNIIHQFSATPTSSSSHSISNNNSVNSPSLLNGNRSKVSKSTGSTP